MMNNNTIFAVVLVVVISAVMTWSTVAGQCSNGLCSTDQIRTPIVNYTAIANGCGPQDFGGLVPEFRFGSCCDTHDLCYSNCSLEKVACDEDFYQCMLRQCEEIGGIFDQTRQRLCRRVAECYAAVTYDEGCPFYENAQREACSCEAGGNSTIPQSTSKSFRDLGDLDCVFLGANESGASSILTRHSSITAILACMLLVLHSLL